MSDQIIRELVSGLDEKWIDAGDGTFKRVVSADNPKILSGTSKRPANTTQYAKNDVVGIDVSVVGVTAHSNGLCKVEVAASVIDTIINDGDYVTIASIVGTTEANGNFLITKIDATHFTIPITFVNAYTSGGTISKDLQFDLGTVNAAGFFLSWFKLSANSTVVTNAQFAVYLHTEQITSIADNSQATMLAANVLKSHYLGTFVLVGGGTGSDSIMDVQDINRYFKLGSSYKRVFLRLVNTSETGWIPPSGTTFTVIIGIN